MKNIKLIRTVLAVSFLLVFSGCYTPESTTGVEILPQRLKTIAIPTIVNSTEYYGINEDLTTGLIEKFIQNGRLTIADEKDADCMLKGEIIKYKRIPLSYDENDIVEQYRLRMIVNLIFVDLSDNTILWDEIWRETEAGTEIGGIVEEVRFFVSGDNAETEELARERIVTELSEEIIKRTIYGW